MKRLGLTTLLIAGFFIVEILCAGTLARAQEKSKHDMAALAKASQNPIADLISLPFENTTNFEVGTEDAVTNDLTIKPVYPTRVGENWNLINRALIPIKYQEERFAGEGSDFGIGDITYQGFFSPASSGELVWGVGPMVVIPVGSGDRMSSDKWSAGPSIVGLMMPGNWVCGGLVSNVWSFAGEGDADDVNLFSFQYFINYNMKGGWYLTTSPTITANWEADSDNTWTVPFGGGFGRVFKIGKQPVNMKLTGYYNADKPDYAADWTLQAQMTFLFPK